MKNISGKPPSPSREAGGAGAQASGEGQWPLFSLDVGETLQPVTTAALAISFALLVLSLFRAGVTAQAADKSRPMHLSKAGIMARRLTKGIVVDVAPREGGSPAKVLYDPAQYDAVKAAGFRSVRLYVVGERDPANYQRMIRDALDRELAVVISFWGKGQWASKPKEGIHEFVAAWARYARFYKDYPDELVFDLWNEPAGLMVRDGKPIGINDGMTVMKYLNAVIPVVRRTNPNRTLGIGGPGLNGAHELAQFVTPEHLTYRLENGTGFEDDDNIIGLFHMYHPGAFTHWTLGLNKEPGWQQEVRELLSDAAAWSQKWRKPVVLSEWGAWAPPCHSVEDFKAYIGFVVDECRKHEIGWIYYCAGYNNQWGYNILHTEDGWNQDALDILTGVTASPSPPLSPLINPEFSWSTANWSTDGSARISVARNAGLSGRTALKIEARESDHAEVYQQTPKRRGSSPGRYLISVRNGRLYKISFLAKSVSGTGTIRVRLADVSGSRDGFWTSMPVEISSSRTEYTIAYRHVGGDVSDVRLAFLCGGKDQVILLDRIALRGDRE